MHPGLRARAKVKTPEEFESEYYKTKVR